MDERRAGRRVGEVLAYLASTEFHYFFISTIFVRHHRKNLQDVESGIHDLLKNFGIELSSQEVPLQVLSSIYNVSQLSSRWISVVPLSTLKTPKQKSGCQLTTESSNL
jgi:hypothetical protein